VWPGTSRTEPKWSEARPCEPSAALVSGQQLEATSATQLEDELTSHPETARCSPGSGPSTSSPDLTPADRRAYTSSAKTERHKTFENIEVSFG
jgi:hypothetical protein